MIFCAAPDCGKEFAPRRSTARFCSSVCRLRAHRSGKGDFSVSSSRPTARRRTVSVSPGARLPTLSYPVGGSFDFHYCCSSPDCQFNRLHSPQISPSPCAWCGSGMLSFATAREVCKVLDRRQKVRECETGL